MATVEVFLTGLGGKTSLLRFDEKDFACATVGDLKQKVYDKTAVSVEQQRLIFCGRPLAKDSMCLPEYGLRNKSTVVLVCRVAGGGAEKAEGHCMITLDDEAFKMPGCGHGLSAAGLVGYVRSLTDAGNWRLFCPVQDCKREWSYCDLRNYGWFATEDQEHFEAKLSENWALRQANVQQCPGCHNYVEPKDARTIRSVCPFCKLEFCWLCLHRWRGSGFEQCGCGQCHPQCSRNAHTLRILLEAPPLPQPIAYCGAENVPSIRACPTCSTLSAHANGTLDCKHVICTACKKEFCFLCLNLKEACRQAGTGPAHAFKCAVAPVQTTLARH